MKAKYILILGLIIIGFWIATSLSSELIQVSKQNNMEISMNTVQAEVTINAPLDEVWLIVAQNFDKNSRFNVDAKDSFYLKEVEGMIGSQRRTVNYKDKVIDVEVVAYDQIKSHVKWEIFNMNVAPLKAGYSSYTLHDDGKGGTVLVQNAAFKMKVFFMDWIAKGKFTTMFKTELAAIKHLAETAESITVETKNKIREQYADDIIIVK
jgi:hypothetical protein